MEAQREITIHCTIEDPITLTTFIIIFFLDFLRTFILLISLIRCTLDVKHSIGAKAKLLEVFFLIYLIASSWEVAQ